MHQPAGAGERLVRAALALQLRAGEAHELVDVAMVVGEQQIGLHVFGGRARIVGDPRQREVGAQRIEEGQRPHRARRRGPEPVADLVADLGELGGREVASDRGGADVGGRRVGGVQHVRKRDLLLGAADLDLDVEVLHQEAQLLSQVVAEQVRPGDRHRIDAGLAEAGVGARQPRRRGSAQVGDAQLRIGEGALRAQLRVRRRAVADERLQRIVQRLDRAPVFLPQPRHHPRSI